MHPCTPAVIWHLAICNEQTSTWQTHSSFCTVPCLLKSFGECAYWWQCHQPSSVTGESCHVSSQAWNKTLLNRANEPFCSVHALSAHRFIISSLHYNVKLFTFLQYKWSRSYNKWSHSYNIIYHVITWNYIVRTWKTYCSNNILFTL